MAAYLLPGRAHLHSCDDVLMLLLLKYSAILATAEDQSKCVSNGLYDGHCSMLRDGLEWSSAAEVLLHVCLPWRGRGRGGGGGGER